MTVFAAPINVKNAALTGIGAKPMVSEAETSAQARVLNSHYELIVQEALTKHAYAWAKKSALLVKRSQTPEGRYVYALPADILNLRYITYGSPDGRVVDVEETDEGLPILDWDSTFYGHYTWRVPEARWPADFADGIVKKLQAALKRGLLSDDNAAEALDELAEKKLRRGMVRDKRQIRGRPVNPNPRMVQVFKGYRRHGSST
jgi:hypothetical protein